jgi:hypothetical protein
MLSIVIIGIPLFAQTPVWQWATHASGAYSVMGKSVAVDTLGNTYSTGSFGVSASFGDINLLASGNYDVFVAKHNSAGEVLWAVSAGGTTGDSGNSIAVDTLGNVYVTGTFSGTAAFGNTQLVSNGFTDIFVAKLNTNGNWLWAKKAGGGYPDESSCITLDTSGNAYISGFFNQTAIFGTHSVSSNGLSDLFIAKLDNLGNWQWVRTAGSVDSDNCSSLDYSSRGYLLACGSFTGTVAFGTTTLFGSQIHSNAFVSMLDVNGNWQWTTMGESTVSISANSIAVNDSCEVYVGGVYNSQMNFGNTNLSYSTYDDVYVAKFDTLGTCLWLNKAGGDDNEECSAITVDHAGNSYITGCYSYTAYFDLFNISSSSVNDIYVAKLSPNGSFVWVLSAGALQEDYGQDIALDGFGNLLLTGYYNGDCTIGANHLPSSGTNGYNYLLAKLALPVAGDDNLSAPPVQTLQNYPNPFSSSTTIRYTLDKPAGVKLSIYNLRGQKVRSFREESKASGEWESTWDGKDNNGKACSPGIYYLRLETAGKICTRKAILVR